MTIVVVGAGAIGLLVAGRLAQTGRPTALLARPAGAAELARTGIRIVQAGQSEQISTVAVLATPGALPAAARPVELAILCVKGYDTAGALPALATLDPQQVLTLQNGIGNEALLIAHFGAERVISGAITTSVEVAGPGHISITKAGGVGLAPTQPGGALASISASLASAGFPVSEYADYRAMKWSKALLNMLGNATAALLDMPVGQVYADPALFALEHAALREALRVMERLKIAPINLPRYRAATLAQAVRWVPVALLRPVLRQMIVGGRGGKPPSLLLDLTRGNPRSEGEFLYGAVAQAAANVGLEAPVNRRLWEILSAVARRETPWEAYRGKPEELIKAVLRNP